METFFVDDITIITPAIGTDTRGAAKYVWTNATEVNKKGWMAQSNASAVEDDLRPNRDGTSTTWRLFIPKESVLDNRCRIRYLGDLYEVVGRPHMAKTPAGNHHLEVPLKLVEG